MKNRYACIMVGALLLAGCGSSRQTEHTDSMTVRRTIDTTITISADTSRYKNIPAMLDTMRYENVPAEEWVFKTPATPHRPMVTTRVNPKTKTATTEVVTPERSVDVQINEETNRTERTTSEESTSVLDQFKALIVWLVVLAGLVVGGYLYWRFRVRT